MRENSESIRGCTRVPEHQPRRESVAVEPPGLQDRVALLDQLGGPRRLAFEDEQLGEVDREQDELVVEVPSLKLLPEPLVDVLRLVHVAEVAGDPPLPPEGAELGR